MQVSVKNVESWRQKDCGATKRFHAEAITIIILMTNHPVADREVNQTEVQYGDHETKDFSVLVNLSSLSNINESFE